jgi:site-specific recombinase XerD
MSALAPALQAYFTDRLISQRAASPNTIAAYKLTFRLLLAFASQRTGKPPSALDIAEVDAALIAAFLDYLERDRHNSVAPATTASPRSTRSSAISPCTIPSTRRRCNACSPSHPSGPSAT